MNETKWLSGLDGEAMLELVADRLSARQWILLSTAAVRRLWDLFPDGVLRQAVDFAERSTHPLTTSVRDEWTRRIDAAIPTTVGAVELAQRQIVKSCDPDAADIDAPVLARPNQIAPAFPLFQAASRNARNSIEWMADAVTQAIQAVRGLFTDPNEELFGHVRQRVDEAAETRTNANRAANTALRMKQEGDELADRAASSKNKRIEESIALEKVRQMEEKSRGGSDFDAEEKRDRAARKLLAQHLREIVGNPFKPPRFEAAWRTSTVVQIAQGIYDDRSFDRSMPILADALLDADCDEEAILRHCRGTETHAKEPFQHVRGCWVIELILGRYEALPPERPGKKPRPKRRSRLDDLDLGFPLDLGDDRLT